MAFFGTVIPLTQMRVGGWLAPLIEFCNIHSSRGISFVAHAGEVALKIVASRFNDYSARQGKPEGGKIFDHVAKSNYRKDQ